MFDEIYVQAMRDVMIVSSVTCKVVAIRKSLLV